MTMIDRVKALKTKHATLDEAIQSENCRPIPDANLLYDLKRQKLRIKEEIVRLAPN